MAIITRWSYKRGGCKAGFHCIVFIYTIIIIISDFILKVSRRKEVQVYTNGLFQVSFGVFFFFSQ